MEPVLKFVNVNKYYNNNVHALHNINLEIAAGEFISVIGPSGSGKSTLLRTVNRLIDVSDGEICLDGENITSIGGKKLRAVRRKVGMIFQNYNLVYRLSVLQNVLHGYLGYLDGIKGILGIYPEEEKLRAISLLEEMGLGAFCYNRAADLSGGQKQRLCIARALLKKPKVLILDDFLANGKAMKGLLDVCAQAGATVGGIGICIEKGFQPGGAELRAAGYKLASLAIVDTMTDDQLTFREQ